MAQVHAKGAGAYGTFQVTTDFAKGVTSSSLFKTIGKTVPATVRFSTVAGESGSADTHRDLNGFAIKLKTNEGIWDWVFLNAPVFFIRDPAKYPDLVHATKRNPQTNLKDANIYWVMGLLLKSGIAVLQISRISCLKTQRQFTR